MGRIRAGRGARIGWAENGLFVSIATFEIVHDDEGLLKKSPHLCNGHLFMVFPCLAYVGKEEAGPESEDGDVNGEPSGGRAGL